MAWKTEGLIGAHFPGKEIANYDVTDIFFAQPGSSTYSTENPPPEITAVFVYDGTTQRLVWRKYEDTPTSWPSYWEDDGEMRIVQDATAASNNVFKWSVEKKLNGSDTFTDVTDSLLKTDFWSYKLDDNNEWIGYDTGVNTPIKAPTRELSLAGDEHPDGTYRLSIRVHSKNADASYYPTKKVDGWLHILELTKGSPTPPSEYVYYLRIKRPENYGIATNHVLLNGEMISSSDILYAGKYGVSDDFEQYTVMDDTQLNTLRTAGEQQVGIWASWVEYEIHTTTPAKTLGISTPQYYCPQSNVTVTVKNDNTGTSTEYSDTMGQNNSYNYEVK